jgi:hypothetical protein
MEKIEVFTAESAEHAEGEATDQFTTDYTDGTDGRLKANYIRRCLSVPSVSSVVVRELSVPSPAHFFGLGRIFQGGKSLRKA